MRLLEAADWMSQIDQGEVPFKDGEVVQIKRPGNRHDFGTRINGRLFYSLNAISDDAHEEKDREELETLLRVIELGWVAGEDDGPFVCAWCGATTIERAANFPCPCRVE